jgi:LPS-assembly protein
MRRSTTRYVLAGGSVCAAAVGLSLALASPAASQNPSVIAPATTAMPNALKQPTVPSAFPKAKNGLLGPIKKIDQTQPLYLQGDELVYDSQGNRIIARGNVEIYYNNYILLADEIIYDQGANTLSALGNVTLKEPNGLITRGERITLTDDFRDGFVQSLSVTARDDTRIAAERAVRRDGNVTEFQNGRFTPCKTTGDMPPLWCISAGRVVHDQAAATITYQDAQFEIFGVPIFGVPYFQHADPSVKQQSGFLAPSYLTSNDLGFGVEVPYYFALAPNYDFTFHPMYTAKQGVLWQGDWRHRLSFGSITGTYTVKVAAIDQDYTDLPGTAADSERFDGWRGSVETKGKFSLSSWWNFGWDVTLESDDYFRRFYKLDNVLQTDRINQVYLTGLSERNYFGAHLYHFGGLRFDDTATTEGRVHPIIDYNYVFADPILGGELTFNANALSFSRSLNYQDWSGEQALNRVVADVNWRRRFTDSLGQTYTPFASLRGDLYALNNYVDPVTQEVVGSDTVARGIAAAGLLYAYPFVSHSSSGAHVVEPVGQIIARQASLDQRHLPNEDSRSIVFDDTNLFELDKMSGLDRVETGTRANVGVQYTFQANSGGFARLLAGQSYHLAGDNIYRNPGDSPDFVNVDGTPVPVPVYSPLSGLESDRSDYVFAAYLAPSSVFRTIAQTRFDEGGFGLRRADLFGEVNYGPLIAQATYSYATYNPLSGLKTDQEDIFSVVGLQLTDRWSVLGSIRYDLDAGARIQDAVQLRSADDCFVLTASYTETFIDDPLRQLEEDRTLMLRFELKHLGEFHYKTDALDHFFAENQPGPN